MQADPSSSTAPSITVVKPLKRRLSSQDISSFFTPAATSFRPRPYAPQSAASSSSATSARHRLADSHLPPPGMDPQITDPNVIFVHPPFITFPNSHLHPEGLSYQLMANNPEWFLDPNDFKFPDNTNPNAITYPPHLEPPRGWCPAKKKDLKDRGAEGWPEGEEPRLRCTFCRRTYAGVNAKSMWRRHVFEKHKIAMSNRRDGNDRPRGRGSNSESLGELFPLKTTTTNQANVTEENRHAAPKPDNLSHDSIVSIKIEPQTEFQTVSHKSKFRSLLSSSDPNKSRAAPKSAEEDSSESTARHHPLSRSHLPPPSPPLTPRSTDAVTSSQESTAVEDTQESSPPAAPTVPPSPYDPLQTPAFRHSPPPLPSDQPWRYPSPSHPLHSRSRELSLSMLIRDFSSPINRTSANASPRWGDSPMATPRVFGSLVKKSVFELETPDSLEKLSKTSVAKQTPIKAPKRSRDTAFQHSSPIVSTEVRTSATEWLTDFRLTPLTSKNESSGNDPFASTFSPWKPFGHLIYAGSSDRPASAILNGTESPVVRSSSQEARIGLGIGLLEPFRLADDKISSTGDEDLTGDLDMSSAEEDETEVAMCLSSPLRGRSNSQQSRDTDLPVRKKRRLGLHS